MQNGGSEDVVGVEIEGSLACVECYDLVYKFDGSHLRAAVTRPVRRGEVVGRPWFKCEACGCSLERR